MATDSRFDGPGPDAQYLQALDAGRFMLQHCEDCARVGFPPALVCSRCGSSKLAWRASTGHGTVYSATTIHDRDGAYNVVIVELEGGARMMSRVDGVEPDDMHIGQRVCARIVREGEPFVVFTLDDRDAR